MSHWTNNILKGTFLLWDIGRTTYRKVHDIQALNSVLTQLFWWTLTLGQDVRENMTTVGETFWIRAIFLIRFNIW